MKVVINACYGGFELSHKAVMRYAELAGIILYPYDSHSDYPFRYYPRPPDSDRILISYFTAPLEDEGKFCGKTHWTGRELIRTDPILIRVIEELGEEANGFCAELKIIEIPDGVEFEIDEYDGMESIHEKHRSWD